MIYANLSSIYLTQKSYQESIKFAKKAASICEKKVFNSSQLIQSKRKQKEIQIIFAPILITSYLNLTICLHNSKHRMRPASADPSKKRKVLSWKMFLKNSYRLSVKFLGRNSRFAKRCEFYMTKFKCWELSR